MQRRAGHRPGAEHRLQGVGQARLADREAEPQAGQPIGLAEGAQRQRAGGQKRQQARLGREIGEGLVDDQQAAPRREPASQRGQALLRNNAAIGIVRVDQDDDRRVVGLCEIADLPNLGPGLAPGRRMLAIGRAEDGDARRRHQARQQFDQDLRARRGDEAAFGTHAIGLAGGREQRRLLGPARQALPQA